MTTVTDYNAFLALQKRYPRTVSNDYLMPGGLRELAEHGLLSYAADERALFMYERREGFYKLYFRLRGDAAELPPCGQTLAAFLVYREGGPPGAAAEWLTGQGFRFRITLARHVAKGIGGVLSDDGVEDASADETYALLGQHFSAAEADLPCRAQFEGACCVRSEDGTPVGVLYKGAQTRLEAIRPEARGRGLGRRLYLAYAAGKLRDNPNAVFHEWIRLDNTASLSMFNQFGFVRDGVMTDCYVKE